MSNIKAGDLVMVVRPASCCGGTKFTGKIFVALVVIDGPQHCSFCGKEVDEPLVVDYEDNELWYGHPPSRLIRIDPLAEPEQIETEREVVA